MKKLLPYILCFIFFSCSTLNVEKVIKSETSYFDVNRKVKKIIEKKFLIDKSESKPLWETHIKFDSKNRIVSLREHRIYMDIETGEYELMEPSITQYIYNGNKVKEVQFHTYGTTENYENDIEPEYLNIISYNYLDKNKATFEAHRYGSKDHQGVIKVVRKNEVERILEYENREPLIYNSIYDKNAKLISNKKTFYHLENKIVDSTQYKYSNGLMTAMITEDVVLLYEYEFDNHKNWIKRSTKTENEDLITEEIVREIIYVDTVN